MDKKRNSRRKSEASVSARDAFLQMAISGCCPSMHMIAGTRSVLNLESRTTSNSWPRMNLSIFSKEALFQFETITIQMAFVAKSRARKKFVDEVILLMNSENS
jgi:hypothetical protein